MIFHGLQKLSLLDYPGKMVCTVFTGGCNLRCPFCHNASLVARPGECETYDESEIFALLEKRRGVLDGVAVTGGEPLMHPDIVDFLKAVKAKGFAVKLDTNGFYPERLKEVLDEKAADYVAMDVKNSPEKYAATVGVPGIDLSPVRESIALLMSGSAEYEFRTTVVGGLHEKGDFEKLGEMIRGAKRLYLQCYKDSGDILGGSFEAPGKDELEGYAREVGPFVEMVELRGV